MKKNTSHNKLLTILILIIELLIIFSLICSVFQALIPAGSWMNVVDGSSMEPNLQHNQIIFTIQDRDFKHGDIITAQVSIPSGKSKDIKETLLIKRIIGVPGDTVSITKEGILLNGFLLDESAYLPDSYQQQTYRECNYTSVTLKDGEYFILGDNRGVSNDSRNFGPVSEKNILYKQSEKPATNFYVKCAIAICTLICCVFIFLVLDSFLYFILDLLAKK